jgi:serine/threonine protein kinase
VTERFAQERWLKVESLFLAATALPPEERGPFLDQECLSDAALRTETESLLAMDADAANELTALIEGAAAALFCEEPLEGALFGTWRIVREIGRGGMGAVYLAERDGADFEKRVAIKLVKRGIDTASLLGRFLEERRILAGLDHPYIARLIDGDTTQDGRPWFIMELVEGVAINDYCVRERLTLNQRCELFRKVCTPVSYAHGRLVIHRDLKPANILITPDGTPKLLDFGIAKLLTAMPGKDNRRASALTHALTPQYASPEQMAGEPVDTASDVFSLGVVLGELVSGGEVPEDLRRILAMATRAQAEQRYRSVEHFSEDVGRYLAGRPVTARESTWRYRARRFVVRNRTSVAAGTLAAVLLISGIISILWESRQARLQKLKAEQRLGQMVEMANGALFDVHRSIERLPGATEARRKIVKSTVDYLDKLRRESGEDTRVLSTLASAYHEVAKIEGGPLDANLGDLHAAEENFGKAQKIVTGLVARDPRNKALRLQAAELRSDYGEMTAQTGRADAAIALYQQAQLDLKAALASEPGNFIARKTESVLHLRIDAILLNRDPAAARREDMAQLPLNEALMREHPDDVDCILNLASTWSQIATTSVGEGDYEQPIEMFRKAAALRERALTLRPEDPTVQRDLMIIYGHIGDTLGAPFMVSAGKYRDAVDWYAKAAAIARKMSDADPSNNRARMDLGISLMRIGAAQTAAGRSREALSNLDASATLLDPSARSEVINVALATQAALLYEYKAHAYEQLRETDAAISSWRHSLDLCARVLAINPTLLACRKQQVVGWIGLGPLIAARGDSEGALRQAHEALDVAAQLAKGSRLLEKAYWPRALAGEGDVYVALAKKDPPATEQAIANWRSAADRYQRAMQEWKPFLHLSQPYAGLVRDTKAKLAESERALRRSQ